MAVGDLNYTAPPTVSKFMRSEAFLRLIKGPIGSGKSVGSVIEVFRQAIQMPPGPDGIRRSRYAIIRNTNQQLKDTTLKTWMEWVKEPTFGYWREGEKKFVMQFNDVYSEILFRPLDSPADVQRVLSLELTGAWLNECREIPVEILMAVMGRVGRYPRRDDVPAYRSFVLGDTNPPEIDSEWHKIFEHIPLEDDDQNSVVECDAFHQPSGVSPEAENVDHLKPNYYQDLAKGKKKAWIDTYIHGLYSPSQAGKPVYHKVFKPERHLSIEPLKIRHDLPVIIGFDCGLTPAALFKQMDLDGRIRVLREAVGFDMGMKRFALTKIKPIVLNFFPNSPLIFVGDPAGKRRADSDESTAIKVLKKEFRKFGAVVKVASTNDPVVRIEATETLLNTYPDGEPQMVVDPSCKWYIQGLRSKYMYAQLRSGEYQTAPKKNNWSHIVEAGQYSDLYLQSGKYDPAAFIRVNEHGVHPLHMRAKGYRPAQQEGY